MDVAPFFVIGSPRSGTSMLRLMLTCNPRLIVPPECGFILWLRSRFGDWTGREFANGTKREFFVDSVVGARKFETWNISPESIAAAIVDAEPHSYASACDAIYRLYANRSGKSNAIWGDKNNYYLAHIDDLKALFPLARFLHIVRDGRDVACSYRELASLESSSAYRPHLPTSIPEIARQWAGDVSLIRNQLSSLAVHDWHEIRYEDLVSCPLEQLQQVCNWLGVAFSSSMLEFHLSNIEFWLEPKETLDWKLRTRTPVSASTVGRHKRMLAREELSSINTIAKEQLSHYGYLL